MGDDGGAAAQSRRRPPGATAAVDAAESAVLPCRASPTSGWPTRLPVAAQAGLTRSVARPSPIATRHCSTRWPSAYAPLIVSRHHIAGGVDDPANGRRSDRHPRHVVRGTNRSWHGRCRPTSCPWPRPPTAWSSGISPGILVGGFTSRGWIRVQRGRWARPRRRHLVDDHGGRRRAPSVATRSSTIWCSLLIWSGFSGMDARWATPRFARRRQTQKTRLFGAVERWCRKRAAAITGAQNWDAVSGTATPSMWTRWPIWLLVGDPLADAVIDELFSAPGTE